MYLRSAGTRLCVVVMILTGSVSTQALETAFTYQGQLLQDGDPTTATCDLQFGLFDAASGGTLVGSTQTISPVNVAGGFFTAQLNSGNEFGVNAFNGNDRWMQIAVRCPVGSGSYTTLNPRQQLTAAPYALYAPAAGSAASLTCTGCVGTGNIAPNAVTDQSLAGGISYGKLTGVPTSLPPNGVASGSLSGSYPNPSIATGAVGATQLQDNAVTAAKIANGTITGTKIFSGTITGSNVASGTLTGANIADGSLTTTDMDFSTGNINLPHSTSLSVGVISRNGTPFIHDFGTSNLAVGYNALTSVTTGLGNTAIGQFSLWKNTSGSGNLAVSNGGSALTANTTGGTNIAVGSALNANTTGSTNVAVGADALSANTTGSNNTALGFHAGYNLTTGNNNIDVGNEGVAGESNTIRIGTAGTQSKTFIAGINGTATTGSLVVVNSSGQLGTGTVSATQLEDDAVTGAKIANGTITGAKLANGSVSGANIANGAITAANVANDTLTGADIADGSLSTADINFLGGNINLSNSTANVGNILKSGSRFIHNFGTANTFVGVNAGNLSTSGFGNNTAVGSLALTSNTNGPNNTGVGSLALTANTSGQDNTAVGAFALSSNSTGFFNTGMGKYALTSNTTASNNSAVGTDALRNNTSGSSNTALGSLALTANTTAARNTAVGAGTLNLNTTGGDNTAVGAGALSTNTTGGYNTAVGSAALANSTNASIFNNTALGSSALAHTTASNNTAVGESALVANSTGVQNVAVGRGALFTGTTGNDNAALGTGALLANTVGSNNTALGTLAGSNLTTGSNNIDIGSNGVAAESNTIRIGTSGTQTATYVAGISGATSSAGVAVFVNGNGQLGTATSSARFKDDIEEMGDSTSALMQLRPVRFRYKNDIDPAGLEQYGLVAEEVAKVYPDLVVYDDDGRPQTVRYHFVNAMLLNEVQKQARRIRDQQEHIATLTARMERLEAAIDTPGHTQAATSRTDRANAPDVTANRF